MRADLASFPEVPVALNRAAMDLSPDVKEVLKEQDLDGMTREWFKKVQQTCGPAAPRDWLYSCTAPLSCLNPLQGNLVDRHRAGHRRELQTGWCGPSFARLHSAMGKGC